MGNKSHNDEPLQGTIYVGRYAIEIRGTYGDLVYFTSEKVLLAIDNIRDGHNLQMDSNVRFAPLDHGFLVGIRHGNYSDLVYGYLLRDWGVWRSKRVREVASGNVGVDFRVSNPVIEVFTGGAQPFLGSMTTVGTGQWQYNQGALAILEDGPPTFTQY